MTEKCLQCRAPIRMIRTPLGKGSIAVNTLFLSEWVTDTAPAPPAVPRRISLLSSDGSRMEVGYLASAITPTARAIQGYQPHWATCPAAREFAR